MHSTAHTHTDRRQLVMQVHRFVRFYCLPVYSCSSIFEIVGEIKSASESAISFTTLTYKYKSAGLRVAEIDSFIGYHSARHQLQRFIII